MNDNFIMARFDRDPSVTFQVFFYDESVNTTPISFRGKQGVQIRLNSPYSVQRAKQQGWQDITEEMKVVENSKKLEIPESVIVVDAPKKKTTKRKTRSKK